MATCNDDDIILLPGYLMHITKTVQYALVHNPEFQDKLRTDGLDRWFNVLIGFAVRKIKQESGISGLSLETVWIGYGCMNFCWSLPDRFFTTVAKLSEEDRRALKKFKRLAGVRGKILEFAHCDGEEPPFMRRMTSVPDVLMPFTIMDLDEKLRSGEVTVTVDSRRKL